jgi:GTP-binding protein EngB required for normal cell division
MALARMIQIGAARGGRDGFKKKLLAQAEEVLARAGERTRLSSAHTVVVLAGGTGSGKSSLFNKMAGADFSTVGVTRPVTRDAHACIWGEAGSGGLLEWLGVPVRNRYSRASALDKGEEDLAGLLLLDLPDHDSVMTHSTDLVDRLVSQADVMVWVLDPQKYADAAVHRRFLVPLAGHSDVLAAVLNQSDQLDAAQIDDCVHDLRRLLDSEDLHDVPILVTSAVTGAGLEDLRKLLIQGVAARRAAAARISDDVDVVVAQFARFAGDQGATVGRVPSQAKERLVEQFAAAAGVQAVGDALRSARQLRAADFVGWPIAWLAQRLTGRDPIRKMRLGMLWDELRLVSAGPSGAQQAEIDNALTELADQLSDPLPKPWSQTVRAAVRSRADQIPAAVGHAIGDSLPPEDSVPTSWRLAGLGQGLLLGSVVVCVAWMAAVVVFGVFHAVSGVPHLFSSVTALLWLTLATAVMLGAGRLISSVCMSWVNKAAEAERTQVVTEMRTRIASVAGESVIMPAEQELSEFDRFRDEFRIAMRGSTPAPASSPR